MLPREDEDSRAPRRGDALCNLLVEVATQPVLVEPGREAGGLTEGGGNEGGSDDGGDEGGTRERRRGAMDVGMSGGRGYEAAFLP